MYDAFQKMPIILKFLTVHATACFFFFVAAVIPGIPFSFNGEVMSYTETWSSGAGMFTVYIGLAMPFCAWLMLKRKTYSRQIYLFVLISVLIAPYLYWKDFTSIIFGVILTILIAGYMFGKPSVRSYFLINNALQPTAGSDD